MGFKEFWANQFREPKGFGGRIAAFIMNRMNRPMYKIVLTEIKSGMKVLDIGFGNGYMLKKLLKKYNSKFYGIDVSRDMVRLAAAKNKKAVKNGGLQIAEASVGNIPFENKYNQIYTINTVYFWPELEKGLKEVYGKLEAGGEFLNVCYTKEHLDRISFTRYGFTKYSERELIDAMRNAGFKTELIPIKKGKSFYIKAKK